MSTLTTRIGGYKVVMVPATEEQKDSHRETAKQMGWSPTTDYSRATFARFVSEDDDVMSLPFELRSTIMALNPEYILQFMAQHYEDLTERVTQASNDHNYDCNCDCCKIEFALYCREHSPLRGNQLSRLLAVYEDGEAGRA